MGAVWLNVGSGGVSAARMLLSYLDRLVHLDDLRAWEHEVAQMEVDNVENDRLCPSLSIPSRRHGR